MKKLFLISLVLLISITTLATTNYYGGIMYRFSKGYIAKLNIYPISVTITQSATGKEITYFAPLVEPLVKYTSTNAITGSLGLTRFEKSDSGCHIIVYAQPYNPRTKLAFNPNRFFVIIIDLRQSKSKIQADPAPFFESSNFLVWRFSDSELAKKGININVWF